MSTGLQSRQQRQWDWRAAVNFMAGGAGSGLVVAAALAPAGGTSGGYVAPGAAAAAPWLGAALVGFGLAAVWLEIGRPWRALNVLLHPQTSWMSREAIAALVLFAAVALPWMGLPALPWLAALAALAFVGCQGGILRAAKGIPAWRTPGIVPLLVSTALAEGAGLFAVWAAVSGWAGGRAFASVAAPLPLLALFVATLAARLWLWSAWRRRLVTAPAATAALDEAGHVFKGSTLAALALAVAAGLAAPTPWLPAALALAGVLALVGGLWFKAVLVLRAAFNQGFVLPKLPVRGGPRRL